MLQLRSTGRKKSQWMEDDGQNVLQLGDSKEFWEESVAVILT